MNIIHGFYRKSKKYLKNKRPERIARQRPSYTIFKSYYRKNAE